MGEQHQLLGNFWNSGRWQSCRHLPYRPRHWVFSHGCSWWDSSFLCNDLLPKAKHQSQLQETQSNSLPSHFLPVWKTDIGQYNPFLSSSALPACFRKNMCQAAPSLNIIYRPGQSATQRWCRVSLTAGAPSPRNLRAQYLQTCLRNWS